MPVHSVKLCVRGVRCACAQAELIGTAKEGARDAVVRAKLHKQWQEEQDAKEMRQLLQGVQNGFQRPRNGLMSGLDEGEVRAFTHQCVC